MLAITLKIFILIFFLKKVRPHKGLAEAQPSPFSWQYRD